MGGLDGRFFAHQEEIDLCWRIVACGHCIVALGDSVVYHYGQLRCGTPKEDLS